MKPNKERVIKVRFNADTSSSLTWDFKPQQNEIKVLCNSYITSKVDSNIFFYRLLLERLPWPFTQLQIGQPGQLTESALTMWYRLRLDSTLTKSSVFASKNSD